MMGCPSEALKRSAITRATKSVPLPAPNATIRVTGRVG
jgi:hypothetical protein